jgi:endoglucanase
MRNAPRAVAAVAVVALLVSACTAKPDTTLRPRPPAVTYAPLEHPFQGAELFMDSDTAAARWQRDHGAQWLDPITTQPQARWLTSPGDLAELPRLVRRARRLQTLPVLVAYYVPDRGCTGSRRQGAASAGTTGDGSASSSTTSDRPGPPSSWNPTRCRPTASTGSAPRC